MTVRSLAEASKVVMQYVAAVSGKGKDIDRVKEQLLKSNPVLEGSQYTPMTLSCVLLCSISLTRKC